MAEPRYRAFISYSHADERWARWLQRALERYRVPKRLRGQAGEHGTVPDRLRPVFRDREDLSSASDLSSRIKQELEASETLIVVCSPAAAKSRWVNEEIRYFHSLGRSDRIFSLVVDGDPHAGSTGRGCFPPALLEPAAGGPREPLAADIRRYGDGKHVGLLKIVAGILGIRLDELRRRDAQRRLRHRIVNTAIAVLLAVVIAWLFHAAQSSREAVRMQRSNTEELLSFMLGELDRLDPIRGLETIAPDDREIATSIERLGLASMDDDGLLEQARQWREQGIESLWGSDLDAALEKFEDSRAALIQLRQRKGNEPLVLFELGQSEYYVGEVYVSLGEIAHAQEHWSRYGALTRRLVNAEPYNPRYVMELSYTLNNLGALEQQRAVPDFARSLELLQAAVQYNQLALMLDPENSEYRRALATELEWTADAHMGLCGLGDALKVRLEMVETRHQIVASAPDDHEEALRLAFTLSGLGGVQQAIGLTDGALASYRESVDMMRRLSAEEPDNTFLAWQAVYREARIARLLAATGDRARALEMFDRLVPRALELAGRDDEETDQLIVLEAAMLEADHGVLLLGGPRQDEGERRLRDATARLAEQVAAKPELSEGLNMLLQAYFEYWQYFGTSPGPSVDGLLEGFSADPESVQSCQKADLAARLAVIRGDRERAAAFVDYALEKGYYDPAFINFCRRHGLCETP